MNFKKSKDNESILGVTMKKEIKCVLVLKVVGPTKNGSLYIPTEI